MPDRFDDRAAIFSVRLDRGAGVEASPIVGKYRVDGATLRFVPRYPFAPGAAHLARFQSGAGNRAITLGFRTEPPRDIDQAPTTVVSLWPTGRDIPENTLKLYLSFSRPMGRGAAYRHVAVLDEAGLKVDRPFLEIGEELWDPGMTRLTLLFDPGRIKRGLKPREEEGPILEEGKAYTVEVARDWPDATGRPLAAGFRKSYRVGPPDGFQPDPMRWRVGTIRIGSREPIEVAFPDPLDRAMLARSIGVVAGRERGAVPGRVEIGPEERSYRFIPESPWPEGPILLEVNPELEDLAGNSVARPFEVDVVGPGTAGGFPAGRPGPVRVAVPTSSGR